MYESTDMSNTLHAVQLVLPSKP